MSFKTSISPKLSGLGVKGLKYTRCKYSPVHTPIGPDRWLLEGPRTVQQPVTEYKLSQRPRDMLWLSMIAVLPSEKAVVRNRIRRRISGAFKEVLKEKGYDDEGRALTEGKQGLKGSLEIIIHNRAVLMDQFEMLKQEAALLVQEVESRLQRSGNAFENYTDPELAKAIKNVASYRRQAQILNKPKENNLDSPLTEDTHLAEESDLAEEGTLPEDEHQKLSLRTSSRRPPSPKSATSSQKHIPKKHIKQVNPPPKKVIEPHRDYIPYRDLESSNQQSR